MRVDQHTIHLDESPVFYRSAEPTDLPTVYLHGIPTSSDDWVTFLKRTGGIAPDLIGFGRSGKGGHLDFSLDGLANFLERFLAELEVGEVDLVGHDWGAAVALTFTGRQPDRVRRLVVSNAPPLLGGVVDPPRVIRWWQTPLIGEMLMGSIPRVMFARTLRSGSVRSDAWPDSRITEVWDQFDQGTQRAVLRLVRSARGNNLVGRGTGEEESELGAAGAPGGANGHPEARSGRELILWGERDPWYPPALAGAYAAVLGGASVERLPDAGHWPWLDRPDVVETVARFLED